jgi:hypothetical protein
MQSDPAVSHAAAGLGSSNWRETQDNFLYHKSRAKEQHRFRRDASGAVAQPQCCARALNKAGGLPDLMDAAPAAVGTGCFAHRSHRCLARCRDIAGRSWNRNSSHRPCCRRYIARTTDSSGLRRASLRQRQRCRLPTRTTKSSWRSPWHTLTTDTAVIRGSRMAARRTPAYRRQMPRADASANLIQTRRTGCAFR